MYSVTRYGCNIIIREGVTLPCSQAKNLLSLYHAQYIPEGTVFTKKEFSEFVNRIGEERLKYAQSLFAIGNIESAENMEILRKVMISEREKSYFQKRWESLNSAPKKNLETYGEEMQKKWAYADKNRPPLLLNEKGELVRSPNPPPSLLPGEEPPSSSSSQEKPSSFSEEKEKGKEKRKEEGSVATWLSIIISSIGLGIAVDSWISDNPETIAAIKKQAKRIAKEYNRDEELREYLGFPPKTTVEKAVDYILWEKAGEERINRLKEIASQLEEINRREEERLQKMRADNLRIRREWEERNNSKK